MPSTRTSIFVLFALVAACAKEEAAEDPCRDLLESAPPAAVELGTGLEAYESISDGDPFEVIQGPQGAFYVHGSLQARGLYPGSDEEIERYFVTEPRTRPGELQHLNPTVRYDIVDQNGEPMTDPIVDTLQEPLLPEADALTRSGDIVFLLPSIEEAEIVTSVVDFSVTVTDACGSQVSDVLTELTLYRP